MIRQFAIDINKNGEDETTKFRNINYVDGIVHDYGAQNEYELIKTTMAAFNISNTRCPDCSSLGEQKPQGKYQRWLITRENDKNNERHIDINRTECDVCDKTHAILPDIIIPYMQHSLMFVLEVIWQYRRRGETGETVASICAKYGIS